MRFADARADEAIPFTFEEGALTIPIRGQHRILLQDDWLISRVAHPNIIGATFAPASPNGVAHLLLSPLPGAETIRVESTPGSFGEQPRYGQGDSSSILLEQRPMWISTGPRPATAEPNPKLTMRFDDSDHKGQPVWINRTWLEALGFHNPTFVHEDGELVDSHKVGAYIRLLPSHFSNITIYDSRAWALLNDQPNSLVSLYPWETYISTTAQRQDLIDETLFRRFIPHQQYTLSSDFEVIEQGDGQQLYPLGIGNRTERSFPMPGEPGGARKSLGFVYNSGAAGVDLPTIEAYSRAADGTKTSLWSWNTASWPASLRYQGWKVTLSIAVGPSISFLNLTSGYGLGQTGSILSGAIPSQYFDIIFVGTEEMPSDNWGAPAKARTKTPRLNIIRGNHLNENFDSPTLWDVTGDSVIQYGSLRLHTSGADKVGRAVMKAPLTASRFSAQFKFTWGATASNTDPEGMTFLFYKETDYASAIGGALGFMDTDQTTNNGHRGYGVEFDGLRNAEYGEWDGNGAPWASMISVVKDNITNHLTTRYDALIGLGQSQHVATIDVFENEIFLYFDEYLAAVYKSQSDLDRTFGDLGFSGSTGSYWSSRFVDDLVISVQDVLASANEPPYPPAVPSPAAGATNQNSDVRLSWKSGDPDGSPVTNTVYFGTANPPTSIKCVTPLNECLPGPLSYSTQYYWRVSSSDGVLTSPGPVWSFTTRAPPPPNQAPLVPYGPSPASGGLNIPAGYGLHWTGGDPDGDTVTYTVYVGKTNPPTMVACRETTQNQCYVANEREYGTEYFWKVRATDGILTIDGPVWSFVTAGNRAPIKPYNPSPVDDSVDQGLALELSWASYDPDWTQLSYTVTLSSGYGQEIACQTSANSCQIDGLHPNMGYTWTVRAFDGQSSSESTWHFQTYEYDSSLADAGLASGCHYAVGNTGRQFFQDISIDLNLDDATHCAFDSLGINDENYPSVWALTPGEPAYLSSFELSHSAITTDVESDPRNTVLWWSMWAEGPPVATVFLGLTNPPTTAVCTAVLITTCDPGDLLFGVQYYWQVMVSEKRYSEKSDVLTFMTTECSGGWCPSEEERAYLFAENQCSEGSDCYEDLATALARCETILEPEVLDAQPKDCEEDALYFAPPDEAEKTIMALAAEQPTCLFLPMPRIGSDLSDVLARRADCEYRPAQDSAWELATAHNYVPNPSGEAGLCTRDRSAGKPSISIYYDAAFAKEAGSFGPENGAAYVFNYLRGAYSGQTVKHAAQPNIPLCLNWVQPVPLKINNGIIANKTQMLELRVFESGHNEDSSPFVIVLAGGKIEKCSGPEGRAAWGCSDGRLTDFNGILHVGFPVGFAQNREVAHELGHLFGLGHSACNVSPPHNYFHFMALSLDKDASCKVTKRVFHWHFSYIDNDAVAINQEYNDWKNS